MKPNGSFLRSQQPYKYSLYLARWIQSTPFLLISLTSILIWLCHHAEIFLLVSIFRFPNANPQVFVLSLTYAACLTHLIRINSTMASYKSCHRPVFVSINDGFEINSVKVFILSECRLSGNKVVSDLVSHEYTWGVFGSWIPVAACLNSVQSN